MNYEQYLKSDFPTTCESPKASSSINRKQRRIESTPYPPTKIYFHPSYKQHLESQKKADVYRPIPPVVVQNSSTLISPPNTPHELTLPNIRTRSIDLQRAID